MFSSRSCRSVGFRQFFARPGHLLGARVAMAADVFDHWSEPQRRDAGGADFTLTIQGTNFTSASMVLWDGAALKTAYKSEAN
jgi:hypothetical protein